MKYIISVISLILCILVFYVSDVRSQMMNTTGLECDRFNGTNCTTCIGYNINCYWCGDDFTCTQIDFNGLVSTSCSVQELHVAQCVLNSLYGIIIIVAAVLLIVGVLLCCCITLCICCCWCSVKKRNFAEDRQQLQMDRIDDAKKRKRDERQQRRDEIRNKYL